MLFSIGKRAMMKIGVHPYRLVKTFFPGESLEDILPGEEETSLWSAAGSGQGAWYGLAEERRWGPWSVLVIVDEAPQSQYDRIFDRLREGHCLPSPSACVALTGRHFHGQRNRSWAAPRGNLYLTVHLAPNRLVKKIGHGFTLLPAVACVRTIRRLSGGSVNAGIKWVNDIVVGDGKVGGFIAATQIQDGMIRDAVIGLGINIDIAPPVEPTPFVPAVTCLRDHHPGFRLATLLPSLLQELHCLYGVLIDQGGQPLMDAYREYATVVGRSVRIWPETADGSPEGIGTIPPLARGVVSAINDDLSLFLDGRSEPIFRGRLAFEER
jgi:biotin-[acetyl-CoA-carboxylase] ligase BirA-like protein